MTNHKTSAKFSTEVRERAVRMVLEHRGEHASQVSVPSRLRLWRIARAGRIVWLGVLTHVGKDGKAHGGRDHLDGGASAELAELKSNCGSWRRQLQARRLLLPRWQTGTVYAGRCCTRWLRLARDDKMPGISITPRVDRPHSYRVRIEPPAKAPAPAMRSLMWIRLPPPRVSSRGRRVMSKTCLRHGAQVEIALTNGRVIKVDECIDPAALALLVAALDGGAR